VQQWDPAASGHPLDFIGRLDATHASVSSPRRIERQPEVAMVTYI